MGICSVCASFWPGLGDEGRLLGLLLGVGLEALLADAGLKKDFWNIATLAFPQKNKKKVFSPSPRPPPPRTPIRTDRRRRRHRPPPQEREPPSQGLKRKKIINFFCWIYAPNWPFPPPPPFSSCSILFSRPITSFFRSSVTERNG